MFERRVCRVATLLVLVVALGACKKKLTLDGCLSKCSTIGQESYDKCLLDNPRELCDEARKNGNESCQRTCATTFGGASASTTLSASSSAPPASSTPEPLTDTDVKTLLARFVAPGADHATLSKRLRPTTADYNALFDADAATQIEASASSAWDAGRMVIAPKSGQTEFKVSSATTEDLRSGTAAAREFPGGYSKVAPHLNPGIVLYRFSFVEPGKDLGMAFDGLSFVNGHWVIVPKPWRMLGAPSAAQEEPPGPTPNASTAQNPSANGVTKVATANAPLPKGPAAVRAGGAQVNGRLPPEVIQRVVRTRMGALRACYEKGLASNPSLRGTVKVRFVIDRSGKVSVAGDGGSDIGSPAVVSCAVQAISSLAFPQPEGGIVTVVYPFTFEPSH